MFRGRLNMQGDACPPPNAGQQPVPSVLPATEMTPEARAPVLPAMAPKQLPAEPQNDWIGPVTLRATDTTNLWRTSRRALINPWMDAQRMVQYRLWVRFIEEDGEPAVLFIPF
jgi:hypothetical protein